MTSTLDQGVLWTDSSGRTQLIPDLDFQHAVNLRSWLLNNAKRLIWNEVMETGEIGDMGLISLDDADARVYVEDTRLYKAVDAQVLKLTAIRKASTVEQPSITYKRLVRLIEIATTLHGKQMDKVGEPYMLHLLGVTSKAKKDDKAIALFHDSVEDGVATWDSLLEAGLTMHELITLDLLTHYEGMTYDDYISRMLRADSQHGEAARRVKLLDIRNNLRRMTPEFRARKPHLSKRYLKAERRLLEVDR